MTEADKQNAPLENVRAAADLAAAAEEAEEPVAALPPFNAGAVPVPNTLFDEVMPALKDTELRALLVVVRQTLGWREGRGDGNGGARFKRRDWLSHSQLVRRTGRGSEAVSSAISSLVARGLIVIETASGAPLGTPEQRRRHLGRLFFGLGDSFGDVGRYGDVNELGKTGGTLRPAKAKTTTDTPNDKKADRKKADRRSEHSPRPGPRFAVARRKGWHRAI